MLLPMVIIPPSVLTVDQIKAFDKVSWSFAKSRLSSGLSFYTATSPARRRSMAMSRLRSPCVRACGRGALCLSCCTRFTRRYWPRAFARTQILWLSTLLIMLAKCPNNDASHYALANLLAAYQTATGAVVNPAKCCRLWLGANRGRSDLPLGYTWPSSQIMIPGLYFGTRAAADHNFEVAAAKFRKNLLLWSARDLSMKGKRIVINQLAHSKLVYPPQVFCVPTPHCVFPSGRHPPFLLFE